MYVCMYVCMHVCIVHEIDRNITKIEFILGDWNQIEKL